MFVGACTSAVSDTSSSLPSASASASPSSSAQAGPVSFDTLGGDAFAWNEALTGTSTCGDVTLSINGHDTKAPVKMNGTKFAVVAPLGSGRNAIVASCGSGEQSQPLEFDERLTAGPTARIRVTVNGSTVVLDGSGSDSAMPDGAPIERYEWHTDPRHPSQVTLASGQPLHGSVPGQRLVLRTPSTDGEYYASLTVTDSKGRSDTSTTYFVVDNGQARAVDMAREHPSWIDSAVIYAPIPQLWGNGGPKAITRHLEYLKKLGVDALWLWPPSEKRTPGQEYAIDNYFKLDPSWGPESAFKEMIDRAHQLGMHVLLDIVPNHMSDKSPYFQDTKANGTASHYYNFFDRNASGTPTHYFDWKNLPNLNYDNPEVRAMITEAFVHWVRMGIDGFRVDAVWGIKKRRPDFLPELRSAIKRVDPDVLMLAEASAVDPFYFSHGFDVAYDWTDQPGQWAWASAFKFPAEAGALLSPAITNGSMGYAADAIVMRFLNNNDTGIRFVDQYGAPMTKVAAVMQFTLPGIPEMFAGDEIGASYEPYSNLQPIPWKDKHGLLPLYERLIQLKHDTPTLNGHDIDVLQTNADSVLAYVRPPSGGGAPVLVMCNFDKKVSDFSMTMTPDLKAAVGGGTMHDLLTGKTIHLDVHGNSVSFPIGQTTAYVLEPGAS
ncbi:MAG TPA: alpha-amylase family glycosyl hydrolase [Actinomycetota bacterium]|nr:alpha-amylase family glycosyl hydrolase [Actinomycetota bacterium]